LTPSTPVSIRPGTIADAAALAAFAARTFADTFAASNTPEDLQAFLASAYGVPQQTAELTSPDVVTLLAEEDGRLVAYAQLRRGPAPACVDVADAIELQRFYVDRPAHGSGVAPLLMAATQAAAAAAGARHLWLGVWEHNARAVRFYAKYGFADVGSHAFVLGADRQTDRVMVAPVPNR
jgi:ribosomal protein S18 acetylase RimI-like enzyme